MSERALLSIPVGPEDHSRGPLDAKLTVVEYGDYQCPYCGQAYPIVEKLLSEFADSMRLVFRNLPLAEVHPHAEAAAEVAEAVGLQGKFWEMHDTLFEHQRDLSDAALLRYIAAVGADVDRGDEGDRRRGTTSTGGGGFRKRHPERRERHADVLRQRRALRRLVDVRTIRGVPHGTA